MANKFDRYFREHQEEFLKDLKKLIDINSVQGEALPGRPFGEGPAKALAAALEIAESYGLYTENHDNCYGIVQLDDSGERRFDILAHLDVVPADPSSWTKCDPYDMTLIDGCAYGRGTSDDKGPALAAIYALRAIKETGTEVRGVRVVLGCNEETGSADMERYYRDNEEAGMTVTPDASWPVVNIEKGHMILHMKDSFEADRALPRIVSVDGGQAANIICGHTTAVIEGLGAAEAERAARKVQAATGVSFTVAEEKGRVRVEAEGLAGHASTPQAGNNSNTAMLELLAALPVADSRGYRDLLALRALFPHGDTCGRAAGIYMRDEISGELTLCLDILHYSETGLDALCDSRLPLCADEGKVQPVLDALHAYGIGTEHHRSEAHHVPEDSPFVQKLLAAYEEITGEKGKCIAIGGGTYCHDLKNGVAFGFEREGIDIHMHGDDEFVQIDNLISGGAVYAAAIEKLCR